MLAAAAAHAAAMMPDTMMMIFSLMRYLLAAIFARRCHAVFFRHAC